MASSTVEIMNFPLAEAKAIVPAPTSLIPEHIDVMYALCIDLPGFGESEFGPVVGWKDKHDESLWYISAPHGFATMGKHRERLESLISDDVARMQVYNPHASITEMIITKKVIKEDFSWDALCDAYERSETWRENITGFLIDSFNNQSIMWWSAFPAVDKPGTRAMLALSKVNPERRAELRDPVRNYMEAMSRKDGTSKLSHNSSVRKHAEAEAVTAEKELVEALGDDMMIADNYVSTADDGMTFLA